MTAPFFIHAFIAPTIATSYALYLTHYSECRVREGAIRRRRLRFIEPETGRFNPQVLVRLELLILSSDYLLIYYAGTDTLGRATSPTPTTRTASDLYREDDPYTNFGYDDSFQDSQAVEAALNELEDEFEEQNLALQPQNNLKSTLERDWRLSTITERTEYAEVPHQAGIPRLPSQQTLPLSSHHYRAATESVPVVPPGRRAGDLIAFFEDKRAPDFSFGHSKAASAPGPQSSSPHLSSNAAGLPGAFYTSRPNSPSKGGYGSRPSSPTKSSASSGFGTLLSPLGLSSLGGPAFGSRMMSPPIGDYRSPTAFSNIYSSTLTGPSRDYSDTYVSSATYTETDTNTFTSPRTPIRRTPVQDTLPRSPLTSVRNIVAAWKDRSPKTTSPQEDKLYENQNYNMRRRQSGKHSLREGELSAEKQMRGAQEPAQPQDSTEFSNIAKGESEVKSRDRVFLSLCG